MKLNRASRSVLAFAITAMVIAGCDPDLRGRPVVPDSYVGNYHATAARTAVNLEVQEDSFTAVTFTEPQGRTPTGREASARRANANGNPAVVWVIFSGDITTSGNTVRAKIIGVERDGEELAGDALKAYTDCEVTAMAGDEFDDEVLNAIADCLGAAGTATVHEFERKPSELIVGTWDADGPGTPHFVRLSMTISKTTLRFDVIGQGERPAPCSEPGQCFTFTLRHVIYEVVAIDDTEIDISDDPIGGLVERDGDPIELDRDNFRDYVPGASTTGTLYYVVDLSGDHIAVSDGFNNQIWFKRRR